MAIPKYNEIIDLIKKGATIEAQEKIMELREAALGLQEENIVLKEKVKDLEGQIELKEKLIFEPPYYFLIDDDQKDGPYCQRCYDKNKELIRLYGGEATGEKGWWECKACDKQYTDKDYEPGGSFSIIPQL